MNKKRNNNLIRKIAIAIGAIGTAIFTLIATMTIKKINNNNSLPKTTPPKIEELEEGEEGEEVVLIEGEDENRKILEQGLETETGFKWGGKEIPKETIEELNNLFIEYYDLKSKEGKTFLTDSDITRLEELEEIIKENKETIQAIGLRVVAEKISTALNFTQTENNYLITIKESEGRYYVKFVDRIERTDEYGNGLGNYQEYRSTIFGPNKTKNLNGFYNAINRGDLNAWKAIIELNNGYIYINGQR